MSFSPMNIPPGSGPSLETEPGKRWFNNKILWAVVLLVAVGVLIYNS